MTIKELNEMEKLMMNFEENFRKIKRNIKSFFDKSKLNNNANSLFYENYSKNNFIQFYIRCLTLQIIK